MPPETQDIDYDNATEEQLAELRGDNYGEPEAEAPAPEESAAEGSEPPVAEEPEAEAAAEATRRRDSGRVRLSERATDVGESTPQCIGCIRGGMASRNGR